MKRTLTAGLLAALFATTAFAGESPGHDAEKKPGLRFDFDLLAANDSADAWRRWADEFSSEMRTSMGALFGGRVDSRKIVKDAPYSAQVTTESNQALTDGNVISKKTSGAIYRDAEGRTRQESGGDGKDRTIYINDPVEGKYVILSPGTKKAIVAPRAQAFTWDHKETEKRVLKFGPNEIRIEAGKIFLDGKEVQGGKVELKSAGKDIVVDGTRLLVDGKEVLAIPQVVVRTVSAGENADGTLREEVRVQIVKAGDGKELVIPMPSLQSLQGLMPVPPVPPTPPLPGASVMRFESTARLGKGVTTSLGARDFDGVRAEGKSTVWTIPAGQIGNRSPIQVTSESWFSPDLQVTVYSRYNDPRQGESIYRLTGIRRGESSPELYKIPEGYTTTSREADRAKDKAARDADRARRERDRELQRIDRERERLEDQRRKLEEQRRKLEAQG